ncbi:MAG: IclR family transcriptional regulator [Desulfobacterales bacterium]|jgi:DNA-binding IclR family transcriptional regulator
MGTTSLSRGLNLLECFGEKNDAFRAQDLASRLNLPISTVYRHLDILTQHRFLHKNPLTKQYHLGISIQRLGRLAGDESSLVQAALPFLDDLSAQSHETVFLTVLANGESVCIKKIESNRRIRLTIEEGACQSLHAGASSRILLAYQTDTFIKKWIETNGLPRFTPNTICREAALLKVLKLTRKQGYTVSDSEVDAGSIALAAPIFGTGGKLVAGISLAGPKDRLNNEVLTDLITSIVKIAGNISNELGCE